MKKNGTIALLLAVALAAIVACNRDEGSATATAASATTETTMTTATTVATATTETAVPAPSSVPTPNTSPFATSTIFPNAQQPRPTVTIPSDKARETAPRIAIADAKRMIDSGAAVVVDVRTPDAFATGHIPGALNIPFSSVQTQKDSIPKGRPIVVYCA
jgi:hypothetical protein